MTFSLGQKKFRTRIFDRDLQYGTEGTVLHLCFPSFIHVRSLTRKGTPESTLHRDFTRHSPGDEDRRLVELTDRTANRRCGRGKLRPRISGREVEKVDRGRLSSLRGSTVILVPLTVR